MSVVSFCLEVPIRLTTDLSGYLERELQVGLDEREAAVMAAIVEGCRENHCQLDCGTIVDTPADVLRWILEQAGKQLTAAE